MRFFTVRKKGVTLVEVMVAVIILGIMTASAAAYVVHAARVKMMARAQQAATIEANTLMEWMFQAAHRTHYDSGAGYFDPNNDMVFSSDDPNSIWSFDGESYPVTVRLVPDGDDVARVSVSVIFSSSRAVTLTAYRYCEDS